MPALSHVFMEETPPKLTNVRQTLPSFTINSTTPSGLLGSATAGNYLGCRRQRSSGLATIAFRTLLAGIHRIARWLLAQVRCLIQGQPLSTFVRSPDCWRWFPLNFPLDSQPREKCHLLLVREWNRRICQGPTPYHWPRVISGLFMIMHVLLAAFKVQGLRTSNSVYVGVLTCLCVSVHVCMYVNAALCLRSILRDVPKGSSLACWPWSQLTEQGKPVVCVCVCVCVRVCVCVCARQKLSMWFFSHNELISVLKEVKLTCVSWMFRFWQKVSTKVVNAYVWHVCVCACISMYMFTHTNAKQFVVKVLLLCFLNVTVHTPLGTSTAIEGHG